MRCPTCKGSGVVSVAISEEELLKGRLIIQETAMEYGFKVKDLIGHSRKVELVEARVVVVKRLRDELRFGWATIGYLLNRHHSSIIHLYGK